MDYFQGQTYRKGNQTIQFDQINQASDFIAIYFGAHWAPPCRLFTTSLIEFYEKTNQDQKKIEIIFCSLDGNEAAFERNFALMPWTAVPYTSEQRIQNLKQRYGISGIPTLVILDKEGELISFDGRADIQNHQEGAYEIWLKKKTEINQG